MNAYGVVEDFESRVAEFAGAPYAVAVDCCTNAIFLSLKYQMERGVGTFPTEDEPGYEAVTIPARTYVSVANAVLNAGLSLELQDYNWRGAYSLQPYNVVDSAKRFQRFMYTGNEFRCLSFHYKKHLPIGRGGMILCPTRDARDWLRKARYDGRSGKPYHLEEITSMGWHVYMTPEQAARGLALMDVMTDYCPPDLTEDYPDLRKMPFFKDNRHVRISS